MNAATLPVPTATLARGSAVCHLYHHANGEEYLILDLPGDGTFSIGWTSLTAPDNLASRGWERTDVPVGAKLDELVARELSKRREAPSRFLARLERSRKDSGQ